MSALANRIIQSHNWQKLKVEYDGQAGIVFLPKGTFTHDPSGGMKVHVFGKMAMLVEKLQKELGFSGQEVLEKAIDLYGDILKHMSNGYKLVVEDKNGKEIESWRTIKELCQHINWLIETEK